MDQTTKSQHHANTHKRGRGAGRRGRGYKSFGRLLPPDPDVDTEKPKPTLLFPDYKATTPKPLTKAEKTQVAYLLSFRTRLRQGPYYTIIGDDSCVGKLVPSSSVLADPFEGTPTYGLKYVNRPRRLPKLDSRPYGYPEGFTWIDAKAVMEFFPKELWLTLNPTYTAAPSSAQMTQASSAKRKKIDNAVEESLSEDGETLKSGRKLVEGVGDEEVDDEYEEDDEDVGDYNAEQYFDDGGNNDDDLDEGDADGGNYY
ncbi:MAG: hypothetical protein Q9214_005881 [Letrouitia sp. 1 TL-2023]